jgi:GrpB-like predicted nucleotidyltransferase (UPF0157 family)
MISIIEYQPAWQEEFTKIGGVLRQALGPLALRIDHIGSTAVPGLAAKDIIDIQVTVNSLEPEIERTLQSLGYNRLEHITEDHIPPGKLGSSDDWAKRLFKPPASHRATNVHIRLEGHPNQRYPLLFRDYLRTHPEVAQAYAQVKQALAKYHGNDLDAYYDVKDPVCDIIMVGAEDWCAQTHWGPGPSDC